MSGLTKPKVAIVDYSLGNLFSVKQACEHAGLQARVTHAAREILEAEAVILPGVGAFGDAMAALRRLDLVGPLREVASSDKPLLGICLGMQLFLTESYEFGRHRGLGLIPGEVVKFDTPLDSSGARLKVPQVGWNRIYRPDGPAAGDPWAGSLLEGLAHGAYMYFVHSYYVQPDAPEVRLSLSRYGHIEFCSALKSGPILACQFHPERSGPEGLKVYENLAEKISRRERSAEGAAQPGRPGLALARPAALGAGPGV